MRWKGRRKMSKTTETMRLIRELVTPVCECGRDQRSANTYPFASLSLRDIGPYRIELTVNLWDNATKNNNYNEDTTDETLDAIESALHRQTCVGGDHLYLAVFSNQDRIEIPDEDPDVRHLRASFYLIRYTKEEV